MEKPLNKEIQTQGRDLKNLIEEDLSLQPKSWKFKSVCNISFLDSFGAHVKLYI
jgi:hypothetical protein